MPPQSRAQRRRKNTQQTRRASSAATRSPVDAGSVAEVAAADDIPEAPVVSTRAATPLPAPATRAARPTRRPAARPVAEPVDYSADYQHARRDIVRIVIWSGLLFAAMIALRFSGLI